MGTIVLATRRTVLKCAPISSRLVGAHLRGRLSAARAGAAGEDCFGAQRRQKASVAPLEHGDLPPATPPRTLPQPRSPEEMLGSPPGRGPLLHHWGPTATAADAAAAGNAETAVVAAPRTPNFNDTAVSYAAFSTGELFRSLAVLRLCAVRPLVEHAEALLHLGRRAVGDTLVDAVLRRTFFAHFCAGETPDQVGRTASRLSSLGIGGILDYAAENAPPPQATGDSTPSGGGGGGVGPVKDRGLSQRDDPGTPLCRTYDYSGEAMCDQRADAFRRCIHAVRTQAPGGFAAVKLTALGDPVLLCRLTACVQELRGLFKKFDADGSGTVTVQEFQRAYRHWFHAESPLEQAAQRELMDSLGLPRGAQPEGDVDLDEECGVDYIEWSDRIKMEDLPTITGNCRNRGPLAEAALDEDGTHLMHAMQGRIDGLCQEAAREGVRLMIDAEQSWFQLAIDNTVYGLQRKFNRTMPTIYGTYQMYLKDAPDKLATDLDRAARGGYIFAGKLVRGAYVSSERQQALRGGYPSPICETIEDTHFNFESAVDMVLEHKARLDPRAEVMIATHNQASVEHCIRRMQELGIAPWRGVSFGQLLGMADHLSFPLGACGYQVYKYIPYGQVGETMPYLLRRAQENSSLLGGGGHERALMSKELRRRLFSSPA